MAFAHHLKDPNSRVLAVLFMFGVVFLLFLSLLSRASYNSGFQTVEHVPPVVLGPFKVVLRVIYNFKLSF